MWRLFRLEQKIQSLPNFSREGEASLSKVKCISVPKNRPVCYFFFSGTNYYFRVFLEQEHVQNQ